VEAPGLAHDPGSLVLPGADFIDQFPT
jgi:hypothetical protein